MAAVITAPPTTTGTPVGRLATLDGIRGVCAVLILFGHVAFSTIVLSSAAGPPPAGIWSILAAGEGGSLGTFFVLSGMLLYRPFVRVTLTGSARPALGAYAARRAARLLPACWVAMTLCLLLLNLDQIGGAWDVLRPYLLAQVYDAHNYAGMDVLWTVPAEAQFYIVLPLLAWVSHLIARRADDVVSRARRLLVVPALLVVGQFVWTAYLYTAYETWNPAFFYPLGIIGIIGLGMAFAVWTVRAEAAPDRAPRFFGAVRRRPNLFWLGALAMYLINCAHPFAVPGTADWVSAPAALVRNLLMLLFTFFLMAPLCVPGASSRFMNRVLTLPPVVYVGRISYGVYVYHFFVMYLVFGSGSIFGETVPVQMLLGRFGFWELFLPVLAGTLVISAVSWHLIEQPIIRAVHRATRPRAAAGAGART